MNSAPRFSYEIIQLRPNTIMVYTYFPDRIHYTGKNTFQFGKDEKLQKSYSGILSPSAKKKLRQAIELLIAQADWKEATNYALNRTFKFRVNFITLTLSAPQGAISDKEIKRVCLNNFLNRAKKKWGMNTYVWRAERQQNTNLHFHITTDVFIHYADLCRTWNECQELLGFVSRFRERTGSFQPNSTDIHATNDIKNLAAYLVKYMSKKEKDAQIVEGKVWGCSSNLLNAKRVEYVCDGSDYAELGRIFKLYESNVFENDHCSILTIPEEDFKKVIPPKWRSGYESYLASVRNWKKPEPKTAPAISKPLPSNYQPPKKPVNPQLKLQLYA